VLAISAIVWLVERIFDVELFHTWSTEPPYRPGSYEPRVAGSPQSVTTDNHGV